MANLLGIGQYFQYLSMMQMVQAMQAQSAAAAKGAEANAEAATNKAYYQTLSNKMGYESQQKIMTQMLAAQKFSDTQKYNYLGQAERNYLNSTQNMFDKRLALDKYNMDQGHDFQLAMQGNMFEHLDKSQALAGKQAQDYYLYKQKMGQMNADTERDYTKRKFDYLTGKTMAEANVSKYLSANRTLLENRKLDFQAASLKYFETGKYAGDAAFHPEVTQKLQENVTQLAKDSWQPMDSTTENKIHKATDTAQRTASIIDLTPSSDPKKAQVDNEVKDDQDKKEDLAKKTQTQPSQSSTQTTHRHYGTIDEQNTRGWTKKDDGTFWSRDTSGDWTQNKNITQRKDGSIWRKQKSGDWNQIGTEKDGTLSTYQAPAPKKQKLDINAKAQATHNPQQNKGGVNPGIVNNKQGDF